MAQSIQVESLHLGTEEVARFAPKRILHMWALRAYPAHYIIELPDGTMHFMSATCSFDHVLLLGRYRGYHPTMCTGREVDAHIPRLYGLELVEA